MGTKNRFNKENVLICWNSNDFSKSLVKEDFHVATSYQDIFKIPFQKDFIEVDSFIEVPEFVRMLTLNEEFSDEYSDFNKFLFKLFELIKSNFRTYPDQDEEIADYFNLVKALIEKNSDSKITQEKINKLRKLSKSIDRSKPDGRKKEKEVIPISALVVLCELTWINPKDNKHYQHYEMFGIQLVKHLRRDLDEFRLPVVFVSFLSRAQQYQLSSIIEIISTPALGHFYQQLPSSPNDWFSLLNESIKTFLSIPELKDVKGHFCDREGMLRELNHDLLKYINYSEKPMGFSDESLQLYLSQILDPSKVSEIVQLIQLNTKHDLPKNINRNFKIPDFETIFRKISEIMGSDSSKLIDYLRSLPDDTYVKCNNKIERISESIYNFINKLEPITPQISERIRLKVLFLDDEVDSDDKIIELLKLIRAHHIDVKVFSNPSEAFKELQKDKLNLYDIVISDYRIWNESEKPRILDQKQGYTFIQDCAGLPQSYTFVVLSALDRDFLMKQIGITTVTLYKNGVLASKYSMLNFIQNLYTLGVSNKNAIASKFSSKKVFIKCYNWIRNNNDFEGLEKNINNLTIESISEFKKITKIDNHVEHKKNFPTSCLFHSEYTCKNCGLNYHLGSKNRKLPIIENFLTNYRYPEQWDPANTTHVKNLMLKFAARRIFLYYFFTLERIDCKHREYIVKQLVRFGWFNIENRNREEVSVDPAKDLWLTVKHLNPTREELRFLLNQDS